MVEKLQFNVYLKKTMAILLLVALQPLQNIFCYVLFIFSGHRLDKSTVIGICIFTMVTAIWFFMGYFLQLSLRKLLMYKGLLYESRG